MVTALPAEQVRVLVAMAQLMVPVMPEALVIFVLGRLSVRMVFPVEKFAAAEPLLPTWIFHVQPVPRLTVPLTLSVFTAVRSAEFTLTVSLQELLFSRLSVITLFGSTAHTPAVGLAYEPATLAVAVKLTSTDPDAAIDTAPFAEHVSTLLEMLQLMAPVMPEAPDWLAEP